jgi:glucose-6-phosphate 1-dehydrogenase
MAASMLDPADIVIFGGTGDLSLRKIMPALYYRHQEGQLNPKGRIIAIGRGEMTRDELTACIQDNCKSYIPAKDWDDKTWKDFANHLHYAQVDAQDGNSYKALATLLADNPREVRMFYLATPASIFGTISQELQKQKLITEQTRVVLEKPLGYDMESFRRINNAVLECFNESQVYRIDHYLGKETVQNLMVLRFSNNIFERLWNSDSVDHVQITVAESIGVGSRGGYYDKSGAMRDMVQNHLLQLLCLVAMEAPHEINPDSVRDEKLKVLRSLRPIPETQIGKCSVRGQYRNGTVDGKPAASYLEDIEQKGSDTETFVAIKAHVDNWRWSGVPFYLRTGKRMAQRYSEIVIQFRPVPHNIFPGMSNEPVANKLIIRLQPDESVKLQMTTKVPGPGGYRLKPVFLNLSFADAFNERYPDAYERLLMDVVRGNPTLFMRTDEVEAAWTWTETILDGWEHARQAPQPYTAGSWGPSDAFVLMAQDGNKWHEDF